MKTVLTGIKPTGMAHLGNILGAVKPAIDLSNSSESNQSIFFIADYHALTTVKDPAQFQKDIYGIAATWIALGLDPQKAIFFKQSDVAEVFELQWMLSCLTPKGDMNRAHSYKDRVQKNKEESRDTDHGVNMGLFSYPILMSADILLYDANIVPVGKDQKQHVEIARSIACRVNEYFGEGTLIEPQEKIQDSGAAYVVGLDGRKMSKSYGNTIGVWETEKKLKKLINKIVTDSSGPDDPKDPDKSPIMDLYKLFATPEEIAKEEALYREGIGWGYAKAHLFEKVNDFFKEPREIYNDLMDNPEQLDQILAEGAARASKIAKQTMARVRKKMTGF